ncbi:hypothetical protein HYT52_01690 [Candidatus Woesearchaeota archaeon]|nr:hypothetical protein [Candidatus Woesearchaeota archaeon]
MIRGKLIYLGLHILKRWLISIMQIKDFIKGTIIQTWSNMWGVVIDVDIEKSSPLIVRPIWQMTPMGNWNI